MKLEAITIVNQGCFFCTIMDKGPWLLGQGTQRANAACFLSAVYIPVNHAMHTVGEDGQTSHQIHIL